MARVSLVLIVVFVSGGSSFLFGEAPTAHIFVSPTGNDHNTGHDANHPLKTITKALSRLGQSDYRRKRPVTFKTITDVFVELIQGYHDLQSTVYVQHTDPRRVTIRAYGNSEVHVVLQARLSDAGLSHIWDLSPYGFYLERTAPTEIFYNGEPLRIARYPNEGKGYVNIASLVDGKDGTSFKYSNGDRPGRWTSETDLWAHGLWYWSWADRTVKVKSISSSAHTITLEQHPLFGLRTGHFHLGQNHRYGFLQQGGYFRIINALSELDEQGEYYIDRTTGILYIWPPTASGRVETHDIIYASNLVNCFSLSKSSNIIFDGFTLEACRHYGISLAQARNISIQRMEIRNTGSYGIHCRNCFDTTINGCDIHSGDGGISISGGTRSTLTPSGISLFDNLIHSYSREAVVGANAMSIDGVGIHVHHNELHTGQYTAIRWAGNDHIMEYNHLHHNCLNSSDCGALHTGRDWTYRGNIVRHNYVHHTLRFHPGADVRGVMLDDQVSGTTIENNVFYMNDVHVNIGGGRDNVVKDNIFYEAVKSSMQVDSRGVAKGNNLHELFSRLHAVPYTGSLWRHRYPKLAVIDANVPKEPQGNVITENILYNSAAPDFQGSTSNSHWFNVTQNRQASGPSDFTSPTQDDFRPRCQLSGFVKEVHFPDPVTLDMVGPRSAVGPRYKHYATQHIVRATTKPCTTAAPATHVPITSFLPDGSHTNTLYKVPNQGCWVRIESCPNHPTLAGTPHNDTSYLHRDIDGEQHSGAGLNESVCFARVPHWVQYCGKQSMFSIIYGPSGAMTLGGSGCYFAQYGCPKYNNHNVGIVRDTWAEQHQNAANDEHACLSRAYPEWRYCGADETFPITSIYRPTGRFVTAGGGCWMRVPKCPGDPRVVTTHVFYDAWGATNAESDKSSVGCFQRARDYWQYCGSHKEYPVTAHYRPTAESLTVP